MKMRKYTEKLWVSIRRQTTIVMNAMQLSLHWHFRVGKPGEIDVNLERKIKSTVGISNNETFTKRCSTRGKNVDKYSILV